MHQIFKGISLKLIWTGKRNRERLIFLTSSPHWETIAYQIFEGLVPFLRIVGMKVVLATCSVNQTLAGQLLGGNKKWNYTHTNGYYVHNIYIQTWVVIGER